MALYTLAVRTVRVGIIGVRAVFLVIMVIVLFCPCLFLLSIAYYCFLTVCSVGPLFRESTRLASHRIMSM